MSDINESLSKLQKLEFKLRQNTPNNNLKERQIRTEYFEAPQSQDFSPFHMQTQRQYSKQSKKKRYEEEQPTDVRAVMQENRRLKKCVDRLMKMNDYLKNQLIRLQKHQLKYLNLENGVFLGKSQNVNYFHDVNKLKREIQELNRSKQRKQIEIQKYQSNNLLKDRSTSVIQKHLRSSSLNQNNQISYQPQKQYVKMIPKTARKKQCKAICGKCKQDSAFTKIKRTDQVEETKKKNSKINQGGGTAKKQGHPKIIKSSCRLCYN